MILSRELLEPGELNLILCLQQKVSTGLASHTSRKENGTDTSAHQERLSMPAAIQSKPVANCKGSPNPTERNDSQKWL